MKGFRSSSVRRSGTVASEAALRGLIMARTAMPATVHVLSLSFVLSAFARLGFDLEEGIAEFGCDEGGSFQRRVAS